MKLTHEQIREKANKANVTNALELFYFLYDLNKEYEFNQGDVYAELIQEFEG